MVERIGQKQHGKDHLGFGWRRPRPAEAAFAGQLLIGKQHGAIGDIGGLHQIGIGGTGLIHKIDGGEVLCQGGADAVLIKCSHRFQDTVRWWC